LRHDADSERTPTDRDDLLAARAGDHEAGRRLVRRHGGAMERTARSVLGRWAATDAEDAVQEALIAALTTDALPTGDLGAWLRAIAARKALDQVRRAVRRAEDPLDGTGGDAAPVPAAVEAPEDVLTARALIGRLDPTDRAILVLADVEGCSMAEIAAALGSTRVAVKLRASRARRRLLRQMHDESSRLAQAREERT
jgi:RNA polymerase sigma-70 factor (ECF subfamily)